VDSVKGRLSWDKAQRAISVIFVVGGGLGFFLYGLCWVFATKVDEAGLRGPTMWGSRATIGWNDIASVRRITVKGVPYLLMRSRSSKKEIWFCILGLNESSTLERLQAFTPSDHSGTLDEKSV
jgi:hypothetical protein